MADKTIQEVLQHNNVAPAVNVCIKSATESQVSAMDMLEAKFRETSNEQRADCELSGRKRL